jgi:ZIP family zinc transporter
MFCDNSMTCLRIKLWVLGRKQSISPFDLGVILSVFLVLIFFFKMVSLGSNVGLAFALSIGAGLSTCIGGLIVFFKRLIQLANPKILAVSLSLSAGVMIFISLVEIFGKSVESYQKGFEVRLFVNGTSSCGEHGFVFINKTENGDKYLCSHCDTICEGHSWLATTATFILGVLIIFLMDYIVGIISPAAHEELEIAHLNMLRDSTSQNNAQSAGSIEFVNCEEGLPKKDGQFSNLTKRQLNRTGVLTALAIGLHNIPEGVATYVGAIGDTRVGAALALGIALHNIPEGIAVATPVYFATGSRWKAFMWTFVSALAEPLGAIIAWLIIGDGLNPHVEGIMFGIVCGMMVTISFKELVPNAIKYYSKGNTVIFSILCGMGIMALSLILFAYAGV